MSNVDHDWMVYIDTEVRAVCQMRGWACQIRRKWSVRERPIKDSHVDDHEWKLIPTAGGVVLDDYQYFVLWLERANGRFVLQHDTFRCGISGPHWETATYTVIRPMRWQTNTNEASGTASTELPVGWLRAHLANLTTRFQPNNFSLT